MEQIPKHKAIESQYVQKDVKSEYLPGNLSIAYMYRTSWVESEKELPAPEVWRLLSCIWRIQFEVPTKYERLMWHI